MKFRHVSLGNLLPFHGHGTPPNAWHLEPAVAKVGAQKEIYDKDNFEHRNLVTHSERWAFRIDPQLQRAGQGVA